MIHQQIRALEELLILYTPYNSEVKKHKSMLSRDMEEILEVPNLKFRGEKYNIGDKNTQDGINSRLDISEEQISEKDKLIDIF